MSERAETGDRQKKEPLEIPMNSEGFQLVRSAKYPREDLNRSPETPEDTTGCGLPVSPGGAESGAPHARDAALRVLTNVWPALSESTVSEILRLAQTDPAGCRMTGQTENQ
jgi:hypothetical protein